MCTQRPPYDHAKQLYDRYKGTLDDYLKSTVRALLDLLFYSFLAIVVGFVAIATRFLPHV